MIGSSVRLEFCGFVLFAGVVFGAAAQPTYEESLTLFANKNYADSKVGFAAFIQSHPNDERLATATTCLARCLYERADNDNDDFVPFLALAQSFHQQFANSPQEPAVSFLEAMVPFRRDNRSEARTALKNFATTYPNSPDAEEALFNALLCSARLDDSTTYAEDFAAFRARWPQSAYMEALDRHGAMLLYRQNKWSEARTALKSYITTYPNAADAEEAFFIASLCSVTLGDSATFLEDAHAFTARWPSSPYIKPLAVHEAKVPYNQGKWEEARTELKACYSQYPEIPEAKELLFSAACCSYNLKDHSTFLQDAQTFKNRWPVEPETASLALQGALFLYNQRKPAEAHDALMQLVTNYPNAPEVPDALYHAALCSIETDHMTAFSEEVAALRAKAPQSPRLKELAFHEALSQAKEGHWADGIAALEQFIATTTDTVLTAAAKLNLGRMWVSRADTATSGTEPATIEQYRQNAVTVWQAMRDDITSWTQQHAEASPDLLGNLSVIVIESFMFEGNYDGLAEEADRMMERQGNAPAIKAVGNVWLGVGKLYANSKDLSGAREAFLAAREANEQVRDPEVQALAVGYLVTVAQEQGDDTAARAYMSELAALPDSPTKETHMIRFVDLLTTETQTATPTPTPEQTEVPTPAPTPTPGQTEAPTPTATPEQTQSPAPTATPT